jgi:hypothetical protein
MDMRVLRTSASSICERIAIDNTFLQGWEECRKYCTADAVFSAQAEPLLEVKTVGECGFRMFYALPALPMLCLAIEVGDLSPFVAQLRQDAASDRVVGKIL